MAASPIATVFAWIGVLVVGVIAVVIADVVLIYLRPSQLHRYLHTADGKPAWALVTGASDGIGKAISHELAARGFNVVLHGRNPAKLERVQTSLRAAHPMRDFRILIADATQCAPDVFKDISHRLSDLHLTVLVSNAGGAVSSTPDPFKTLDTCTHKDLADTLSLNAVFPTMLASALVPSLARNGPSLILILGSLSDGGMPLVSAYSATKAYLRVLAEALAREMRITHRNVQIMHLRIGTVTGVSHTWGPPTFFCPQAATLAKEALERVGCGKTVVAPYWPHAIQATVTDWLPPSIKDVVFSNVMVNLRARGLNPQDRKGDKAS